MSQVDNLLLEIGCEEIPARMIPRAAAEFERRVREALDRAGLSHGLSESWGGSRRLAVRVADVQGRQEDRTELVLGPPAKVAFDKDGRPTGAAIGFAKKQGIDPASLVPQETERGTYVGFTRDVQGKTVGEVLAETLPESIAGMPFPKSMRWFDGSARWVRPVHWILALHGIEILPLTVFGIEAGRTSSAHRFLSSGHVSVASADSYEETLQRGHVLIDPEARRRRMVAALTEAAGEFGWSCVEDAGLLDEVVDLVEWPGIVAGRFDDAFLELPREILITTLRHHQKCFSVQDSEGSLVAGFLAVTNTDRDPAGHIRRGNEWVVIGRLEDARFFWNQDRKRTLESRAAKLEGVAFHGKVGSYAAKADRMESLAERIADRLGLPQDEREHSTLGARLAKIDLVTETVGEFPELQGRVGGLLMEADGLPEGAAKAVYSHYQPAGPDDEVPPTIAGRVVALADKLDTTAELIRIGEVPTGSRDPLGLRRATSGMLRIVLESNWALSVGDLHRLCDGSDELPVFLADRLASFLRDRGYTANEILSVFRPKVSAEEAVERSLPDLVARLDSIRTVRARPDFAHLVDLTKRVDNILTKGVADFEACEKEVGNHDGYEEEQAPARDLWVMVEGSGEKIEVGAESKRYDEVIEILSELVDPVDRFFVDVLVVDPGNPRATLYRKELLTRLRGVLTRCFDIRELAGQAEGRK